MPFNDKFPITDIPALRFLANAALLEEVVRRANLYRPHPLAGDVLSIPETPGTHVPASWD